MTETQAIHSDKLETCFNLFKAKGLRSVSIQDICRYCNIPKKELYEIFGNKEGIIKEVLEDDLVKTKEISEQATKHAKNAIHEYLLAFERQMKRYGNTNQILFFDLNKYYSEIGNHHQEQKLTMKMEFIKKNIERGIREKLYRENIDKEIVARIWTSKFELIKEQKWFPLQHFDLEHLAKEFMQLHIRSISTSKGIEMLEELSTKENLLEI